MKEKAIALGLTLFMLITLHFNVFSVYENNIYDQFLQDQKGTNDQIVIVAIDDMSIDALGQWPFDRDLHADLINVIASGNPKVIGIDLMFDASKDQTSDAALGHAIAVAGNVVMAKQIVYTPLINGYKQGSDQVISQIDAIGFGAKLGHINTFPDKDRVIRQTNVFAQRFDIDTEKTELVPSFAFEIAEKYLGKDNDILNTYFNNPAPFYIDYKGIPREYDNIPYFLVLNEMIPPSYFEDKIVIIGPYANGLQDEYITPIMQEQPMFGVEIHANIIQNLLEGSLKKPVGEWVNASMLLIYALLAYLISRKLTPWLAFLLNAILGASVFGIGYLLYQKGYVISFFYNVLTIIMIYVAALAYHYIEQVYEKRKIKSLFGRYVAPQVVDKILEKPDDILLGGEKRMISVLFVDIRGFTPLSEACEPEEIVGILNQYLDLTESAVFEFQGTLDKFIGDATMAIYNAPLDLEDHAYLAVRSAWAMKEGAKALKNSLLEKYGKTVDFGIGVNTGYAVVGNIGSKRRMDYTAIGDTVNTSARLEANAKAGQILLSQSSYDLVKDRIFAKPLGEIKVKGKETLIPIYEVEGIVEDE